MKSNVQIHHLSDAEGLADWDGLNAPEQNTGMSQLFKAVERDDSAALAKAIEDQSHQKRVTRLLEIKNEAGKTLLWRAAELGSTACLKDLINSGADLEALSNSKATPLQAATYFKNYDAMELLLTAGAKINAMDRSEKTAADRAMENDDENALEILINHAISINTVIEDEYFLLREAARLGAVKCLHLLIKQGANVNLTTTSENTALMAAASSGQIVCLETLIQAGAKLDAYTIYDQTAIMQAERANQIKAVDVLIKAGASLNPPSSKSFRTMMMNALMHHHAEIMELLIKAGGCVNETQYSNDRVAHFAAGEGQLSLLKACLDEGVHLKTVSESLTRDSIVELLWSACLEVATDDDQKLECVKELIRRGADVNRPVMEGQTVLFAAMQSGRDVIIKELIEQGANVNALDEDGNTILMNTLKEVPSRGMKAMEYALRWELDMGWENKKKETALDIAVEQGQQQVVNMLRNLKFKTELSESLIPAGDNAFAKTSFKSKVPHKKSL